jgi:hypothetical protein
VRNDPIRHIDCDLPGAEDARYRHLRHQRGMALSVCAGGRRYFQSPRFRVGVAADNNALVDDSDNGSLACDALRVCLVTADDAGTATSDSSPICAIPIILIMTHLRVVRFRSSKCH